MVAPRIGFNILPYYGGSRSGGMFYYALNILGHFARKVPEQLTLFWGPHSRELVRRIAGAGNINTVEIEDPNEIFDHRSDFDVLFTPATWGGIAMLGYPTVHVLPDIQEQFYPEYFTTDDLRNRNVLHPWVSKSSTLLITISNFSKRTIVEKFAIPEKKVRVTHLGVHPIFSDSAECGKPPANMPWEKDFLFYPSNSWKHKNHRSLLDAMVIVRDRYRFQVPVILSGHLLHGDYSHFDIPSEIRARGLDKQVFHLGRIDLRELKYLYLHAAALIHPSLFEGFGLPLVEAMSCGCPVIAARATSIPEVCGDSALYFDPLNSEDMAEKIMEFMETPAEIDVRRKLGETKVREYNAETKGDETLAIIEEAFLLAGEESLKRRVFAGTGKHPLLSVLCFARSMNVNSACAIAELHSEMPRLVQVICVKTRSGRKWSKACESANCVCVKVSKGLRSYLESAIRVANGRYFFFTEGDYSVPLRSFVYCLAELNKGKAAPELLYGDSYVKDPETGRIRELTCFSTDGDAVKTWSCSNLSFVVEASAFRCFLKESRGSWDSYKQMAPVLWDFCDRHRVYKVVNCFTPFSEDPDTERHGVPPRSASSEEIGRRSWYGAIRRRIVSYRVMPAVLQRIVRSGWRTPRGS